MTDLSKAELKKRWGTMQKVVSAEPRARQIVNDILLDMETKPRLMDGRGNAMLVGASIYQACKFYELFCQAGFKGKCAIVTSYEPQAGRHLQGGLRARARRRRLRQYEIYRQMLADHFNEPADIAMNKVEQFERDVKEPLRQRPRPDAPADRGRQAADRLRRAAATYLYIDKKMRDHGLFQAICRVNRLDGDDKDYGYIVDYRDLFNSLETAITDYTSGALDGYEKEDIEGLLADRIEKARDDLDEALERIRALCEPVEPPKNTLQYQQYFCAAEQGSAEQLKANEPKRVELYKAVAARDASLRQSRQRDERGRVQRCRGRGDQARGRALRRGPRRGEARRRRRHRLQAVRGWNAFPARHLHPGRRRPRSSPTSRTPGSIQLIVKMGAGAIDKLPDGIKKDPEAVAETITNNMRKVIVDERAMNPKYYDRMSELLDALIEERRRARSTTRTT